MSCPSCKSSNQAEFPTEINIHFADLQNVDKPSLFAFPKILVCLDCGFSCFVLPKADWALLAKGPTTTQLQSGRGC